MNVLKTLLKLEQKFERYSIPNLPIIAAVIMGLSYILAELVPDFYSLLVFSPIGIFKCHQFWRLFTWIFTTPGSFDYLTLVMIFVYFSLGHFIERAIGTFMYNLYIFFTLILIQISNIFYGIYIYNEFKGYGLTDEMLKAVVPADANYFMTYYFLYAIFLGFALIYSDSIMLLFFVLPIKAKWLAYIDLIWLGYQFYKFSGYPRVTILPVVASWLIFVFIMKGYSQTKKSRNAMGSGIKRRFMSSQSAAAKKPSGRGEIVDFKPKSDKPIHKCAVCGRTEKDDSSLEFRYCSKCNGAYEYCSEHLYTHEHVK